MAYYKITTNKKGLQKAKIQAYGFDKTGQKKIFVKTIYNKDHLCDTKFKKLVEKESILFEEKLKDSFLNDVPIPQVNNDILTFNELFEEWKLTIQQNLSISYLSRVIQTGKLFNDYLKIHGLYDKPISVITVRDIQLFLNTFINQKYLKGNIDKVRLKKPLPDSISFRELEREHILARAVSYKMNNHDKAINIKVAELICNKYNLKFNEYFESVDNAYIYSVETIKGHRRLLRTLFNEALRYAWIPFNPVCRTKVGASAGNFNLKPVQEKEVFSFTELQYFLEKLKTIPFDEMNKRMCIEIMIYTGIRRAELYGLKWNDIDFINRTLHVRRNRLYNSLVGNYEKDPKTRTSKRDIPLPKALLDDLEEYKNWFRYAVNDFDENLDKYYIASNIKREPLSAQTVAAWLSNYEAEFGLKRVTCHGLRHTYCSILLANNIPIQTVSKYMGHSDSTITLQVYSHFIAETKEEVITALDSLSKKENKNDNSEDKKD